MDRKKTFIAFIALVFAFLGGFFVARQYYLDRQADGLALREKGNYTFIKPLLACFNNEQTEFEEFRPLEQHIGTQIATAKKEKQIDFASVYFRDLTSGRWVGINEDEIFSPASLLKVPLLIAYLRLAESKPEILEKQFRYVQKPENKNPLIQKPLLSTGNTYSVNELLAGMIIDSDNDAKDILAMAGDQNALKEIFTDLGIESPYDTSTINTHDYQISAKKYALFFRILYNATFLSRDMSERALKLLSETKFEKGLRAGIPENIPIAHKYGIRATPENNRLTVELGDCGIVYNDKPYIICTMTRGKDPEKLASFIKTVAVEVQRAVLDNAQ